MRWCARCRRRLYDESAVFCPFDGTRLEVPEDPAGASDPHLGTVLQNQFQLIEAIGSGAMGTVYRAWQRGMEREVAVKVLRADLTSDPELRRRFLREGRTSARLDHPNIVSVFMVGETDAGAPYLVMEHLGGETLEQVLEREGRFSPARAADVVRQIAAGLAQAHAAGVVHRDLKPGNIVLLERRGTGELVKIFDFGIAKLADCALAADGGSRLTRDGAIFGTPDYIAPEQAQGGAVDGRADLYSLGVLLYRMLAGRLPFEGNAVAVILAHIGRPPPDLAAVAPDVPADLAAVAMRCLAKDPAHRPATAEDFLDALAHAMRPPTRRPPGPSLSPRTEAMARAASPDPVWAARAAAAQPMAARASIERQHPARVPSEPVRPAREVSDSLHSGRGPSPSARRRPAGGPSEPLHSARGPSEPLHSARGPSESLHPARAPSEPLHPVRGPSEPLHSGRGPSPSARRRPARGPGEPLHPAGGRSEPLHPARGPGEPLHWARGPCEPLHWARGPSEPLHWAGGPRDLHSGRGPSEPLHPARGPGETPRPARVPSQPPHSARGPSEPPHPARGQSEPPHPARGPGETPRPARVPSQPPHSARGPSEPPHPARGPSERLHPARGPGETPRPARVPSQPPHSGRGPSEPPHPARGSSEPPHPARHPDQPRRPARVPSQPPHPARGSSEPHPARHPDQPRRPARVVEAIGLVAAPGLAAARAAASWSPSRTWLRVEAGRARSSGRGRRAVRGLVASVGVALVCTGAGIGAASLLRHAELGSPARAAEPVDRGASAGGRAAAVSSAPTVRGPLRAVLLHERGYTVRALLPGLLVAGRPFDLVFDLWDQAGQPLEVPAVPVTLGSLASPRSSLAEADEPEPALAARPTPGTPGRYRVAVRFAGPGPAAALLELPGESSLHLHFDVGPAPR